MIFQLKVYVLFIIVINNYFIKYIYFKRISYNKLVIKLAIINYTSKERDLLARLMRAEALGEGNLGMLMVGNVVVNRALANCLTFKNTKSVYDAIYQNPGGFSGVESPLFFSNPTTSEKDLANRVLRGEYHHPATNALWFYAPKQNANCESFWWDQKNSGRYKNHCFYEPGEGVCPQIY